MSCYLVCLGSPSSSEQLKTLKFVQQHIRALEALMLITRINNPLVRQLLCLFAILILSCMPLVLSLQIENIPDPIFSLNSFYLGT